MQDGFQIVFVYNMVLNATLLAKSVMATDDANYYRSKCVFCYTLSGADPKSTRY